MNLTVSQDLRAKIETHARRAGMSPIAYARECIARVVGWDEAHMRFEERAADLERRFEELERRDAALRRERP